MGRPAMSNPNTRFEILKLAIEPNTPLHHVLERAKAFHDFVYGSAALVDGGATEVDAPLLPADPRKRGRKPKVETNVALGVTTADELAEDKDLPVPKVEYVQVQMAVVTLLEAKGPEVVVGVLRRHGVETAKVAKPEQWPALLRDLTIALG